VYVSVARETRQAGLMFFPSADVWEFFTPFNQSGERWPFIALEFLIAQYDADSA
jgi:hypothetical protein